MAFLLGWTQNRNSKTAKPGPRGLQGPRVAPWSVPVPLGSHLLLNGTCHGKSISSPHLPRADVSQVDEVHWLPNHGAVNPSSLLLLFGEDRASGMQPSPPVSRGRRRSLENPPRAKAGLAV